MSFIEGVGDEVTIAAIFMLIVVLIATVLNARNPFSSFGSVSFTNWNILSQQSTPEPQEQRREPESNETVSNDSNHISELPASEVSVEPHDTDTASVNPQHSSADSSVVTPDDVSQHSEENEVQDPPEVSQEENSIPTNTLRVRLKYLNDTERTVSTDSTVKVKEFKRNHFEQDISNNKTVRLIFNGRLLQDNRTIAECGIVDGTVVHVHVSHAPSPPQVTRDADAGLDISLFFQPLLAVMLGVCWLSYIQYPQFFNVPSVVLLIVFTLSFLIVYTHSTVEAS